MAPHWAAISPASQASLNAASDKYPSLKWMFWVVLGEPRRLADQKPIPQVYLGRDLKLLVFFQQLLRVLDAGPCRGVCGKVELPIVMDPLQRLGESNAKMFKGSRYYYMPRRVGQGRHALTTPYSDTPLTGASQLRG